MNESPLTLALGAALFSMMALFVVFGNIKKIADVFEDDSKDLARRCFVAVLANTAWKSSCAFLLLGVALFFAIQSEGNTKLDSPGFIVMVTGVVGATLGAMVGLLTGLAASLASSRGPKASQLAATIAFLGQIIAIVIYRFVE